jgi:hypothetical protein
MDKYLELCRNQDEVMESLMLTAPMSTLSVIQDCFTESLLADEYMDCEDLFRESQPVRKSHKSRHDKKAARRKGSPKRFRDRSRKCAHEGHMYKVYARGLGGDCNIRGRKLEKTGRPQSVNVHKDIVPVPEQEPWYIGDYEAREVCEGVTVTMEWPAPEAVYGDGTEPEPMSSKEANDYTLYCLKMVKYWVHKSEQAQAARYDGKLAGVLREELQDSMIDFYEHALI